MKAEARGSPLRLGSALITLASWGSAEAMAPRAPARCPAAERAESRLKLAQKPIRLIETMPHRLQPELLRLRGWRLPLLRLALPRLLVRTLLRVALLRRPSLCLS